MKTYKINEIFYSIQGEGVRTGIPHVFIRFAGCNLTCDYKSVGFECDTDFSGGREMTLDEIHEAVLWSYGDSNVPLLLTGGEPLLQVDRDFTARFRDREVAIETNGTQPLPGFISRLWLTVSPKTAWHTLKIKECDELKVILPAGKALHCNPPIQAEHYLVSPPCQPDGTFRENDIAYCVAAVQANPMWRLSVQLHKLLRFR